MRAAGVILATALALALQTTLSRFVGSGGAVSVDFVLVVVVYAALTAGPVTGLLAGTLGGLAQDALSTGVVGIGGLAKSVVGFLAGITGTQFIVTRPIPRFVVFAGASVLHAVIFMGLYELLDLRDFGLPYGRVAGQAVLNAVVGVIAFQVAELLPTVAERRRTGRAGVRRH